MKHLLAPLSLTVFLAGCSDSNDTFSPEPPPPVLPDFTAADAWMQDFIDAEPLFEGGSYLVVDRELGVIHKAWFGDHAEDTLALLASTSKVPSVMLLMALNDDDSIDFDMTTPIENYLPWQGVWDPAITTENLVSNRSGIPGLIQILNNPDDAASHICQFTPVGTLQECAETLYTTPLPALESGPADAAFDYGGSQWQISGAVAETVGGGTWNQLWDEYIGQPCGLEISTFGNNLSFASAWDGNADSLIGRDNPNMEGGMMASLDDYAKLLSLHLHDGSCGENQVMTAASVASMREARTVFDDGGGYGMGWWLEAPEEGADSVTLYYDPGAWGSISWLDTDRRYAGVVFFEEYTGVDASKGSGGVRTQLVPIIEDAIDAVR